MFKPFTPKSKFKRLFWIALVLFYTIPKQDSAQAQVSMTNQVSTALGNTGSGFVGALQAVDINPARLHTFEFPNRRYRVNLNVLPFGLVLQNNSMDVDLYNSLFGKTSNGIVGDEKNTWTDEDKNLLLSSVDDIFEINANLSFSLFGISYHDDALGSLAFTITDKIGFSGNINKDFFVLSLHGNAAFLGETISFNESKASSWWYREYGLTYARDITAEIPLAIRKALQLREVTGGVTLKFISPIGYADANGEGTTLYFTADGDSISGYGKYTYRKSLSNQLENDDSDSSPFPFPESAGVGYGISIGFSGKINDNLSIGLALNDIGVISFTENVEINEVDGRIDFGGFNEIFDGDRVEAQADSLEDIFNEVTSTNGFRVWLPTHLRLGGALTLKAPFLFFDCT
ncbi:hypothetical protein Ctha_2033 [Chloroherpeton thalassium ATCC 35110]|uniref:DUF5723 domain-containing protein n=1 Tax=Chloroherpeton thalassium (strain ATCC 35110 / GB-78) TaxID=517418 RepID=B3QUY4_CHLT3|nr:DUF5723 family protein [Chloroherpeton thalassium]ACF14485.1 hypothetical protein Ctha_2033 [Chloroherpeton thalassium ATCC 35110]